VSRISFLRRVGALASTDPCMVARADLLRLLAMAGLSNTQTYHIVAKGNADPVPVTAGDLLKTVEMAHG
jgi:hypothetical protein